MCIRDRGKTPEGTGNGLVFKTPETTGTGLNFITAYAKSGGPGENFAEMVSFYALGKLPKEQVELLLPLLS